MITRTPTVARATSIGRRSGLLGATGTPGLLSRVSGAVAAMTVAGLVAVGLLALPEPVAAATSPTVTVGDASIVEGDVKSRTVSIPVTLSQPPVATVTLSVTLVGVSATGGTASTPNVDFNNKGGAAKALVFKPGQVVKYAVVTVYPDATPEPTESFRVDVAGSPAGYTIGDGSGTGTITDDDPGSGLRASVNDASIVEGDATRRNVQFRVTLSQPATTQVSVNYTIVPATATGGYKSGSTPPAGTDLADFLGVARPVVFKPGGSGLTPVSKTVNVTVYADAANEGDETFAVVLSGPAGGVVIADANGIGTIVDDELGPVTLSGTLPSGGQPRSDSTPNVVGSADAGATVDLYLDASCAGPAAASGSSAQLSGTGIEISVPLNATTPISARARDSVGDVSPCSAAIQYTHDDLAPAAPVIAGSSPTSPSASAIPSIYGVAEPASAVSLWDNASCSGAPVATGSEALFAAPGFGVTVAPDATTVFGAQATDAAGNVSACSAPFSYTHQTPTTLPTPTIDGYFGDGFMGRYLGFEAGIGDFTFYEGSSCSGTVLLEGSDFSIDERWAVFGIMTPLPIGTVVTTRYRIGTDLSPCSAPFTTFF